MKSNWTVLLPLSCSRRWTFLVAGHKKQGNNNFNNLPGFGHVESSPGLPSTSIWYLPHVGRQCTVHHIQLIPSPMKLTRLAFSGSDPAKYGRDKGFPKYYSITYFLIMHVFFTESEKDIRGLRSILTRESIPGQPQTEVRCAVEMEAVYRTTYPRYSLTNEAHKMPEMLENAHPLTLPVDSSQKKFELWCHDLACLQPFRSAFKP
jgi:hypothetical protein